MILSSKILIIIPRSRIHVTFRFTTISHLKIHLLDFMTSVKPVRTIPRISTHTQIYILRSLFFQRID